MFISEKAYRARQRALLLQHFDSNETLFLERELTQLRAKIFTVQFPDMIARTFAPKATDIAASAETYSYKVYKPVGASKHIEYKANDIPRVDVVAEEILGKVRPIGAAYGWDLNELRESARLGLQLPEVKARTARDVCERGIDQVLAQGAIPAEDGNLPNVGLNGIANSALVVANPGGIQTGSFWFAGSPPTPDAILKELSAFVSSISNASFNVFATNTLLLPLKHYNYLAQTVYSTLSGDSILTVFKKNNPSVVVAPWYKLDTLGAAAAPRAIAYQKDPMILEAVIPQEFEQLPPEVKGFEFIINCHARCGGVKIYQPLAMRYMDFATS